MGGTYCFLAKETRANLSVAQRMDSEGLSWGMEGHSFYEYARLLFTLKEGPATAKSEERKSKRWTKNNNSPLALPQSSQYLIGEHGP